VRPDPASSPKSVRVAAIEDIPPGASKRVVLGKWDIAVFNVAGTFVACKDACPHQMVSMTGGSVAGTVLTCPGHALRFDLADAGRCVEGDVELSLKLFKTRVQDGDVYVEV
jgi:nitrite reductase/ring-hydroxylating ferredoxin subunit